MLNHRKTIREELREEVEKESAKQAADPPPVSGNPTPAPSPVEPQQPPLISDLEAFFGPEAGRSPTVSRSAEEEAMLFYEDEADYD